MKKILLVEDDMVLGEMLSQRLSQDYALTWSRTLHDSRNFLASGAFDLLILDVGLPDGVGFDLVDFPFKGQKPPVIFLTARSDAETRLRGYELGADEFIPKPFHLKELLLRLQHVFELHTSESTLHVADVIVDFNQMSVKKKNGEVEYPSATEMKVLKVLVDASPRVLSRDEIIDHVWGQDKNPSHRSVDNTIVRIKKILGTAGEEYLRSVRGVGYQWIAERK